MIERTYPGVTPHRSITAPIHDERDHKDEFLRRLTFLQSQQTREGRVPPFPTFPDLRGSNAQA